VSRPHNISSYSVAAANNPANCTGKLVYDAEALFAEREIFMCAVLGTPLADDEVRKKLDAELKLVTDAAVVRAVNEATAARFRAFGHPDVRVLRHAVAIRPTPEPFAQRHGFLFVGPTRGEGEPNTDAVVWFVDHVLPRLRSALGQDISLTLAGIGGAPSVMERVGAGIDDLGMLPRLEDVYGRARVFMVPSRYAAGIPLKVYDAAAHPRRCAGARRRGLQHGQI
jgi:hypothetical protein